MATTKLLILAVCAIGLGTIEYAPYSNVPLMSYGSSPALQTQPPNAIFSQVAYVEDRDTYVDPATNEQIVLANADTIIAATITSGALQGPPNTDYNGNTGRRTNTWIIKARTPDPHVTTVYRDEFTPSDTGTGVVLDTNGTTTYNYVNVPVPPPSGGGG